MSQNVSFSAQTFDTLLNARAKSQKHLHSYKDGVNQANTFHLFVNATLTEKGLSHWGKQKKAQRHGRLTLPN